MRKDEPAMIDALDNTDDLVQRFVDQELSGNERVRFVVRLGRDESLRERVLALEQLVLDVSRLPRPIVPNEFVARVLERTPPPYVASGLSRKPQSGLTRTWQRLIEALWAPRVLQWNLASATAAGCVVLLVLGGVVAGALRWQSASNPDATNPLLSTAGVPRPTVLVRLVVVQPGARTVQAAGDFNGWNPARTPLEQASNGAWTVTLPLEPGRYEYMFVVDGQEWVGDPFAAEQNDDGFGSSNAVLDVRPSVEEPL